MDAEQIIEKLVEILGLYESNELLISNQGQELDGYSALAEFVDLAKQARTAKNQNLLSF